MAAFVTQHPCCGLLYSKQNALGYSWVYTNRPQAHYSVPFGSDIRLSVTYFLSPTVYHNGKGRHACKQLHCAIASTRWQCYQCSQQRDNWTRHFSRLAFSPPAGKPVYPTCWPFVRENAGVVCDPTVLSLPCAGSSGIGLQVLLGFRTQQRESSLITTI